MIIHVDFTARKKINGPGVEELLKTQEENFNEFYLAWCNLNDVVIAEWTNNKGHGQGSYYYDSPKTFSLHKFPSKAAAARAAFYEHTQDSEGAA